MIGEFVGEFIGESLREFVIRNRRRRRISRAIRLMHVTQTLSPRLAQISRTVIGVYVQAWRGDAS